MILIQKKLKKGDTEVFDLINRPIRKYELSIMVAGSISYYGTTNIIFVERNMNDFAFGQILLFYQEDIYEINDKNNVNLKLEQDGTSYHRTKANLLLNLLLKKEITNYSRIKKGIPFHYH